MNYIKIFYNAPDLSVLVVNSYSKGQFMHIFLDKFHRDVKYIAQMASHQEDLIREEFFTDQKSLSITSLQTNYLNLGSSSYFGRNNEIENLVQTKCTFCGDTNHSTKKFSKV